MSLFSLRYVPYRRPFAVPLRTARGAWYEREGVLVRLEHEDGRTGYGEVAPLPDFGTETLADALAYLGTVSGPVALETLENCPESLRCCRFALSAALLQVNQIGQGRTSFRLANCALLPTGETALEALAQRVEEGFRTFKLKIGVASMNAELTLVHQLLGNLPEGGRLRLDANAAFDRSTLARWQAFLAGNAPVEFLEQPLPVGEESAMREAMSRGRLPIALDESVASVADLERATRGESWPGPVVVKASILGAIGDQWPLWRLRRDSLVVSSVFETAIGLYAVLHLAAAAGIERAVGCGTLAYFADDLSGYRMGPVLDSADVTSEILDTVWKSVCNGFARD